LRNSIGAVGIAHHHVATTDIEEGVATAGKRDICGAIGGTVNNEYLPHDPGFPNALMTPGYEHCRTIDQKPGGGFKLQNATDFGAVIAVTSSQFGS
jgi:hypothetical protein